MPLLGKTFDDIKHGRLSDGEAKLMVDRWIRTGGIPCGDYDKLKNYTMRHYGIPADVFLKFVKKGERICKLPKEWIRDRKTVDRVPSVLQFELRMVNGRLERIPMNDPEDCLTNTGIDDHFNLTTDGLF